MMLNVTNSLPASNLSFSQSALASASHYSSGVPVVSISKPPVAKPQRLIRVNAVAKVTEFSLFCLEIYCGM